MSVDDKIVEAIRRATEDAGQPQSVADQMWAWFEGLSGGNERLEDPDSVDRHLELLFQATTVPGCDLDGGHE